MTALLGDATGNDALMPMRGDGIIAAHEVCYSKHKITNCAQNTNSTILLNEQVSLTDNTHARTHKHTDLMHNFQINLRLLVSTDFLS